MFRNRFVSVGGDCQPVWHIHRLTQRATALFFDYLITPIDSVVSLIDRRFEGVFERDNLTWSELPGTTEPLQVKDERFGLIARHHFQSNDEAHFQAITRAIQRQGQAFLDVLDEPEPIIFVRRWHAVDGIARMDDVIRALTPLTDRKANSVLLYLQPHEKTAPIINGRVIACYNPPTTTEWTGDHPRYEDNFALADGLATTLYGQCEVQAVSPSAIATPQILNNA